MLYGSETVALTKRQEAEMEVAELKMLRFSLAVTRMDNTQPVSGMSRLEGRRRWDGLGIKHDR